MGDYAKATTREWGFHTAKVNCVAWSPNSLFVASGGLDCSLIVWSVEKPEKHKIQTSAHSQSQLTGVVWLDDQSIATCGQDGNVKIWDVDSNEKTKQKQKKLVKPHDDNKVQVD